jgi:glutathione reductase (NADPH)
MSFDYDLFVIGGGSGGVRAARIAAAEGGARVGLAEESRMGGTCVIRGCVPKKLMVNASAFPHLVEDAHTYGWQVTSGTFDWPTFRARLAAELTRLETTYRSTLKNVGVTIHDARAEVLDPHRLRLSNGQTITAKHILIATGGRPFVPDLPGAELGVTSDAMFDLDVLPARALVVGGGYIASEFSCILNGLGVKATQACRGAQILRGFDEEARAHVAGAMASSGVDIQVNAEPRALTRTATGIAAEGVVGEFDLVLWATGRVPNARGLGLESLGLTLDAKGAVPVDGYSQTVVPSIYAVGDVTNRVNLTPVAIREGHAFADTVFRGVPTRFDHGLIATAVFTQPELATIGLTEEQAMAMGPTEIFSASFRPMKTFFAGRQDKMLMKLVVDQASQRVVGAHIVGEGAGELIQLAAVAIGMGATKADFDRTVAVHPTAAEEIVTMRKPSRVVGTTA